jgi:hypothetical protein
MQNEKSGQFEVFLFYSYSSQESLKAKFVLNDFLTKNPNLKKIKLVEVSYEQNNSMFKKHNIDGVPTTLVYFNKELRARHLGEFNQNELKTIFIDVF